MTVPSPVGTDKRCPVAAAALVAQLLCCTPPLTPCRELARRVEQFVLRRTREVNARYLPPLTNYVVFCR